MKDHVRLLGILWLALSALNAVGAAVLFILANTLFLHLPMTGGSQWSSAGWLHPFFILIGWLVLVKAAAGMAIGWGLLQREAWARVVTIVMAFLSLFNVPFGTALGIYTLWVLLPSDAEAEYREHSQSAAA